jgi:hypothetical protein
MTVSLAAATPLTNPTQTAAAHKGGTKAGGANQDSAQQIASQATSTNPDGSTITVITYTDGTTSTTTQAAPASVAAAGKNGQPGQAGQAGVSPTGGLLDTSNIGQNATLLAAQEQAKTAAASNS